MIEVKNLVRRYAEFAAVDDVSFSIGPGEVVGLLGHNGAGKTTIMKMLTGFLEPSAGQVEIDGLDVQAHGNAVQSRIGYLPESLPLYPELTVVDYLSHVAQLRGLAASDIRNSVAQVVVSTSLEEKAFDEIQTLSRGYKQRVGVAQAILHTPKVLVLDEPSNGLDPNQIQQMRGLIRSLSQNATVILSTHIMQEVNAMCDRAIILNAGKVVVDERLEELQKTTLVRVRTSTDANLVSALADVPQIADVTALQDGMWRIGLNQDAGVEIEAGVAAIANCLVAAQIAIYELTPQVRDLETLFAEVTETSTGVKNAA